VRRKATVRVVLHSPAATSCYLEGCLAHQARQAAAVLHSAVVVIVAKDVSVPPGKYKVWMSMIYKDANNQQTAVLSAINNIEVK
jgi:hypothetical protein